MPESFPDAHRNNVEPDPIAYSDEKVYGLDPAVHWVQWNEQSEQFPEIVAEIVLHWDDRKWLLKLLNRLGYDPGPYHSQHNPKGIYATEPRIFAIAAVRNFLMRAAGVKTAQLRDMFSISQDMGHRNWRLAKEALGQVAADRAAYAKRSRNKH